MLEEAIWDLYFNGDYKNHFLSRCSQSSQIFNRFLEVTSGRGSFILDCIWTQAIGHLASLEYFYKAFKLHLLPCSKIQLLTYTEKVSNSYLLSLYAHKFDVVIFDNVYDYTIEINRLRCDSQYFFPEVDLWPIKNVLVSQFEAASHVQFLWEQNLFPPLFKPSSYPLPLQLPTELHSLLNRPNLVLIHARCGYDHQGIRSGRNVDIRCLYQLIRNLKDLNYCCVRIGDPSMPRLPVNIPCVDLAHYYPRNSLVDIELIARAQLFVASNSGPMHIRSSFGLPTLIANSPQPGLISSFHHYNTINLPKIWFHKESNHPLSLKQTLASQFSWSEKPSVQDFILKHVDDDVITNAAQCLLHRHVSIDTEMDSYANILSEYSPFMMKPKKWALPTMNYIKRYHSLS